MRSRWLWAMSFVCVMGWPIRGAAQIPESWTQSFDPVQIADNMYYVGSAGLSAFLLTSDEGHVLIDGPMAENTPMILDNIRSLGFDPQEIRIHLVTHAHYDHAAGLQSLLAETGGELWVSEEDAPFIEEGRDFWFDLGGYPPAPVDRNIGHLERVQLGGIDLTAHLTPGHTPGCTSWSGRVTIDGAPAQFVLVCSLSALSSYQLSGPNPSYEGQAEDFCESVRHLSSLGSDVFLANHAGFFALGDKVEARRKGDAAAFLDAGGLDRFLELAAQAIDGARVGQGLSACGTGGA